jgi:hypothetical protein
MSPDTSSTAPLGVSFGATARRGVDHCHGHRTERAMLAAEMAAVNCVELTKVVAGADPPKLTLESSMKFVPLIVSVKAAPPAGVAFGEIVVIVGVGLDPLDPLDAG